METSSAHVKRNAICGICLFAVVLLFASRGLYWSIFLHPDEVPVAKWIGETYRHGFFSDRLYPSGWFQLARFKVAWDKLWLGVEARHGKWLQQDGKIDALSPLVFRNGENGEELKRANSTYIDTGREFNVFLTALSAVIAYLACLQFGLHPLAALFSGLLLGCNPFIMEHSHYCETDLGLVFSFTLVFLAYALCIRRRTIWRFLLFATSCGFAFSCKYTLAPVLLPVAILPFLGRNRQGSFRWKVAAALLAVGLLGFVVGFALGTPALHGTPDYFAKVRAAFAHRPSSSIVAPLEGGDSPLPFQEAQFKLGSLLYEMGKLGWPTLLFFAMSVAFWFRKGNRSRFFNLPAALGLFLLFYFACMPWIRNQETLPFLVMLSLAAALPVDWAIRALRGLRPLRIASFPLAVILFAAFVLFFSLRDGLRMTSFFLLRETRAECQNWLAASMPRGRTIAVDAYLGSVQRGTSTNFINVPELEQDYPERLAAPAFATNSVPYYLRNASHVGRRRNRLPFSRKFVPKTQAHVDAFCHDATRLMSWHVAGGRFRPTFAQPDIELWCLPDAADQDDAATDIAVWFMRPSLFKCGGATLYCDDRTGPFGPDEAMQTVGRRHTIRFPRAERQWAVCRLAEGDASAKIVWNRFATPSQATLNPHGVEVFELDAHAIRSAMRLSAMPGARIRMQGDDQHALVLTSCLENPAEAAFLLRTCGEPEKALVLLEKEPLLSPAGQVEAFRAASAAGREPRPEWRMAARKAVEAFGRAFSGGGALATNAVSVCGVPLRALADCARIRLDNEIVVTGRQLPVFLPEGDYGVRIRLEGPDVAKVQSLFNVQAEPFEKRPLDNGDVLLVGRLVLDHGARLTFSDTLPQYNEDEANRICRELEISWDPVAFIRKEIADIQAARP